MRWFLCSFLLFPLLAWAGAININTASVAELEGLPGIGESKASAIVQYRTDHGPFKSVSELDNVPGIGPSTLANLTPLVTVGDGKTVAAGTSSGGGAQEGASGSGAATGGSGAATGGGSAGGSAPASGCMVNINTADAGALQSLPGIGDSKASAIIQYRTDHGPYASCDGLDGVPGIGAATIANLRACCTVK